jgi:8-oxo-dGTP pyrophosphatase MutT (NUDIX family)
MNLFDAFPALRRHPLLSGKQISLVGISTVIHDDTAYYFEIGKPKYWQRSGKGEDEATIVGVGGIGGSIEQGESALGCLRREVEEELGARIRLELPEQTALIHNWRIADRFHLTPSKKRPSPLMMILVPPRLGGPGTPDHLAILAFRTSLRDPPDPRDLFGLLRIKGDTLARFFAREEWPLEDALSLPGVTIALNGQLPPNPILRLVLTARAFQLLIRADHPQA